MAETLSSSARDSAYGRMRPVDVAFALAGALVPYEDAPPAATLEASNGGATKGGPSSTQRLPWDVCARIAHLACAPDVWRACERCGAALLLCVEHAPFVARIATTWRYDGRMWLLTDRGAMQASRQAARHGERVLHLDARHVADHAGAAVAVPSSTPDVVAVRGVHFDNAVREIRQLRWFAVVDGVARCYDCTRQRRRMRRCWRSWTM